MLGAILCGGASRRMGTDKALVHWDGVPMASRVAAALRDGGCSPIVAIGGDPAALADLGLEVIADRWPGEGPMGAVITALQHADGGPAVVVSCDLPLLTPGTVEALAAAVVGHDAAVPRTDRWQALCAAWAPSALSTLVTAFGDGERSLQRVFDRLDVVVPDVPPADLTNVNTPGDLRQ